MLFMRCISQHAAIHNTTTIVSSTYFQPLWSYEDTCVIQPIPNTMLRY